MRLQQLPDRFTEKVQPQADGCWIWTAGKSGSGYKPGWESGYPYYWFSGRMVLAHRFAFRQLVGVSISGLDLHHTCGRRSCVNPDHLEPLDRATHNGITHGNGAG